MSKSLSRIYIHVTTALRQAQGPFNKRNIMEAYMYILKCGNGSYYTGSTKNLELRLAQHQLGMGSNHTKKYLPVDLVYFEKFNRIDLAFQREKQIQKWSKVKKIALIDGNLEELKLKSKCK
jgi:putative endonuclease